MEDLSLKPFEFQQRVADCQTLYVAHQGRHHEEIERQMRGLGHTTFNRRVLYARNERGRSSAGWPERFGGSTAVKRKRLNAANTPPATGVRTDAHRGPCTYRRDTPDAITSVPFRDKKLG